MTVAELLLTRARTLVEHLFPVADDEMIEAKRVIAGIVAASLVTLALILGHGW